MSSEQVGLARDAADVYIESFPFGSNTSLLEAALAGLAVVPAYAPLAPMLVASDDSLVDLIRSPASEEEYISRAVGFARDPAGRETLGQELRSRLLSTHVEPAWLSKLEEIQASARDLVHKPNPIQCEAGSEDAVDVGLSLFGALSDPRLRSAISANSERLGLLKYRSYLAKHVGRYGLAARLAFLSLRGAPADLELWRLAAIASLGPVAKGLRQFSCRAQSVLKAGRGAP
jgi:hypothetical protein